MKYCLHCGRIYAESYYDYNNENCLHCGYKLIEDTNIAEEQFLQLSESEKDDYELKIYNICKQSEFFNESEYLEQHCSLSNWYCTFRFDKYEQLSGKKAFTKENELYHEMESRKRINEAMDKYAGTIADNANVPKCPTCQSTNIEKISLAKKAVGGALFGLFSSNVRKTMHCKNCGYKW